MLPTSPDLLRTIADLQRRVRDLEVRRNGQGESPTFIVGGVPIGAGLYIPPKHITINPDLEGPEWRTLLGFRSIVSTGSLTLQWVLNDLEIATQTVIPGMSEATLADPITLYDGDLIRPVVTANSDDGDGHSTATGMSAALIIAAAPAG